MGGIVASNSYPAEFIRDNLTIRTHVIHTAWLAGRRAAPAVLGQLLLYCKLAAQPMKDSALRTRSASFMRPGSTATPA